MSTVQKYVDETEIANAGIAGDDYPPTSGKISY
jgi:hypothetical protein